MEKKIDEHKLKIKYIIGSYRDSDDFPTSEDILYELTKEFCTKSAKELKFTNESLKAKYSLSDKKCNSIINGWLNKNIIEIVKQKEDIITYEIKLNLFV